MDSIVRLIYLSKVSPSFKPDDLNEILRTAHERNPTLGITGLLTFNSKFFLQVLEGPRKAVCQRYHRIAIDHRHDEVTLISFSDVEARRFEDWSMGFIGLDEQTQRLLLKYTANGELTERIPPAGVLELLTQLSCELRARNYLKN